MIFDMIQIQIPQEPCHTTGLLPPNHANRLGNVEDSAHVRQSPEAGLREVPLQDAGLEE